MATAQPRCRRHRCARCSSFLLRSLFLPKIPTAVHPITGRPQEKKQKAFCTYFRKNWLPHLDKWVKASMEHIDHSNEYTNGHIEACTTPS